MGRTAQINNYFFEQTRNAARVGCVLVWFVVVHFSVRFVKCSARFVERALSCVLYDKSFEYDVQHTTSHKWCMVTVCVLSSSSSLSLRTSSRLACRRRAWESPLFYFAAVGLVLLHCSREELVWCLLWPPKNFGWIFVHRAYRQANKCEYVREFMCGLCIVRHALEM